MSTPATYAQAFVQAEKTPARFVGIFVCHIAITVSRDEMSVCHIVIIT
jgi:hypothetical protein